MCSWSGVVGGLVAVAIVAFVVRWALGGKEWREERKKHMAAWKEKRKEWRQDHKDRRKAYKEGIRGWRHPGKGNKEKGEAWEPSDLEKIIGWSSFALTSGLDYTVYQGRPRAAFWAGICGRPCQLAVMKPGE